MYALFDADIIVFRAGFAAERQQWFLSVGDETPEVFSYKRDAQRRLDELLPGIKSRVEGEDYQLWAERYLEPLDHAIHNVNELVEKALAAVGCTEFDAKFYLSGKGKNFRYDVAKTRPYKGNRDDKHRPTYEDQLRAYIRGRWETHVTDGIEADDALGIAQCSTYGPQDSIIVSIDKDLDQIPGWKYNFLHEIKYEITPEQANYNFCHQVLTGDSTDNIPGLPGVGKAKADKMLDGLDASQWRDEVMRQYASKSGREDWWEYLEEQATLVWIKKAVDEDPLFEPRFDEETIDAVLF